MREDELRKHAECSNCRKPIGHTGLPLFWTVKIQRHGLKVDALQRNTGLTMFFGGNAQMARIMGADEELTQPIMNEEEFTLCEDCAIMSINLMALIENKDDKAEVENEE